MYKNKLLKHAALIMLQVLLSAGLFAQTSPLPKQWDKRYGGAFTDDLRSLQQTRDGGYILGGYSLSDIGGDKTEESRGYSDYWIVKIDANGEKQWDKRYGGTSYDELRSLEQTTDGGYILGGYSSSGIGGDKTQASRGSYDYWVVKIDGNGIKQWDKRFGGPDADYLTSLQQTTDGGFILGGYSNSFFGGDKTQANCGFEDYWVVKIDANGIKQWDKRFGGSDGDFLYSLQQTTDGGYILGGFSWSGSGCDKTEASRGYSDYWVVKIDGNGTKQWDKRFGGTSSDVLQSLQQTTDGGYILGGTSYSGIGGDKTEGNRGGFAGYIPDYWVVKIDANGAKQWDKSFGGSSDDQLYSLDQTTDGGYILGGISSSGIGKDKSQDSWGGYYGDYWIVKTDLNGTKEWDARFGGGSNDYLFSLQQTTDGGYILGGRSSSGIEGNKTQASQGYDDYWVVKLGCPPNTEVTALGSLDICQTGFVQLKAYWAEGNKYQWFKGKQKIAGATDTVYNVTEAGNYCVVVYTNKKCGTASKPVVVTNSCGKIANNLSVFPNPSHGIVTLTYNSTTTGNVQLSVYDKTGKAMFTKTEQAVKGKNTYQLNLSNLINGMYNLQITNSTEQSQTKLIIEK